MLRQQALIEVEDAMINKKKNQSGSMGTLLLIRFEEHPKKRRRTDQ